MRACVCAYVCVYMCASICLNGCVCVCVYVYMCSCVYSCFRVSPFLMACVSLRLRIYVFMPSA